MRKLVFIHLVCGFGLVLMGLAPGCVWDRGKSSVPIAWPGTVGRIAANRYQAPDGQVLTPAGRQVELPGLRPQALALSADGRFLATSGKTHSLVILNPEDGKVLQRVPLSSGVSNALTAVISFSGLVFSPDSRHLYLSSTAGRVWAFALDQAGKADKPVIFSVPDAKAPGQTQEIPTGLAVSADGERLYVAGNLGNRLHELEASSGKLLRSWDTGVAPQEVALVRTKAYVSNRGGRRPSKRDLTELAGKGTKVLVDPVRHIANDGSVTVIDLESGSVKAEIPVELHPGGLAVSPGGKYLVVANAGSDTLSVIDTASDRVIEKIWARQTPADLFGAQPNSLAFDATGEKLFVCNGTQNAVAEVRFEPEENTSRVAGLIPVGWFPGAIQYDARRKQLCVANMKGIGANKASRSGDKTQLNTKDFFGSISLIPVPTRKRLAALTQTALQNIHYPNLAEAFLPARPGQPARPIPERIGEPSVFKHVIYVIKENRTYDQILGDMPQGNGDASLCVFGEKYTPNQHKLAREFVLLDNTYCSGVQSSDGHQWTDSAIANEYVERQITSNTPRSYSGAKEGDGVDALAWASSGFIWDNAVAHNKTFRNYGEWVLSESGWKDRKRKNPITWNDFWRDYKTGGGAVELRGRPALATLRPHSNTNTVGWDLKVPDVMRAAEFIRELRQFETQGKFPDLTMLFLPNDHCGGTRGQYPTPGAQIADNDLALGQVIEAVSKSRFWPETCILVIEDDPQSGWDHVSGYRTTCFVASPYTRRGKTISTQYNHASMIHTIELILGLPPMNYLDATATPMNDCFVETPDFTPFVSVPNHIPLNQINPDPKQISHPVLRRDALLSARLPLDEVDRCPEDVYNRILWRAMKGPETPYPEWAVKTVEGED